MGLGNFKQSTLRKLLDFERYDLAVKEFKRWNKITINGEKVVSAGLSRRRKAEAELFNHTKSDDISGQKLSLSLFVLMTAESNRH